MQRSFLRLLIGVNLTVFLQLSLTAAPPPLVLFKQKLQVKGDTPGPLLGATLIRTETEPAVQDRYSSFHGDAQVVRQQPGKTPQSVSLAEAFTDHHWLEVAGLGTKGVLRVRAVKADPGVVYEIEIRATTLALADGDELKRYGQHLKKFEDQQQRLTQIEEIRRLCAQLGDADAVDFQNLVWGVNYGSTHGVAIEKALTDWCERLHKLVNDPRALRFVAEVQAAQAETSGLPAPELLGRHFAHDLRSLQSDYLLGKDRDKLSVRLAALRQQFARLKSDSSLKHFAAARFQLTNAMRGFTSAKYTYVAQDYLDDCILTYADPANAAESAAMARLTLDHLPASYPRLSEDQEVHKFLAELDELDQAVERQREKDQNNPLFSKFDVERQELGARFIFLHPAQRPALRNELAALRQQFKLP